MRETVVYIAASLDGFIAKKDDDISFLDVVDSPGEDYGYSEFNQEVDTVIMGRRTYEKVLSISHFPHPDKKTYILTKQALHSEGNIEFYNGDITELIEKIKANDGKNIYIDGGAEVIGLMMKENLIDRYIISIIPILLGEGIRLFKEPGIIQRLQLKTVKHFKSGLVQLHYTPLIGLP